MSYEDEIIDHFKHPRNYGKLKGLSGTAGDPFCGDLITMYVKVKDGRIDDVKFEGRTFWTG